MTAYKNALLFHCSDEDFLAVLKKIQYDWAQPGTIDFAKIVPMPEEMNLDTGIYSRVAVEMYLSSMNPEVKYYGENKLTKKTFDDLLCDVNTYYSAEPLRPALSPEQLAFYDAQFGKDALVTGRKIISNIQDYNCANWDEWQRTYWGTSKVPFTFVLNSEKKTITFETYDGFPPESFMEALSTSIGNIAFTHHRYCSDYLLPEELGTRQFQNGQTVYKDLVGTNDMADWYLQCAAGIFKDIEVQEQMQGTSITDPDVCDVDLIDYGYTCDRVLPIRESVATALYREGAAVLMLGRDNTEKEPCSEKEIVDWCKSGGLCGIMDTEWEQFKFNKELTAARKLHRAENNLRR